MLHRHGFTKRDCMRAVFAILAVLTCFTSSAFGQNWTTLSPAGTPPAARQNHTAVYDPNSNRMIVFGGFDGTSNTYYNDVWTLSFNNPVQWTQLNPTGAGPSPRRLHSAAYDSASNKMIVLGGAGSTGCVSDAWILSNANGLGGTPTWSQLTPAGSGPGQRSAFIANYGAGKLMVVGGLGSSDCASWIQDIHLLSNATGASPSWSSLAPSETFPLGTNGAVFGSSFYDASSDRLVFWGWDYPLSTLVMLNGASGAHPPSWQVWSLSTSPTTAASGQTAVYNATSNRALFFGGNSASGPTAELWGLGNANGVPGTPKWVSVAASGPTPPARMGHTSIYEAALDTMIVFGGLGADGLPLNDVGVLDHATQFQWSPLPPALTAIAPNHGSVGTTVRAVLSGTDFIAGHTTVTIAGSGITVSTVGNISATSLSANFTISTSATPGPHDVTVTTPSGTSNAVTFTVEVTEPPSLTSANPAVVARNTSVDVTLGGTNFVPGQTTVVISGTGIDVESVNVANPTQLTAHLTMTADVAANARTVAVTTPRGTSNTRPLTVLGGAPTLNLVSPNQGGATSVVKITLSGTNFIPGSGQTTVSISGTGVTVGTVNVLNTQILTTTFTVETGAAATVREVTVTTPNGTSNTRPFKVLDVGPALNTNGITPMSGSAFAPVVVSLAGSRFIAGHTTVAVSGTGVTVGTVNVVNPTRLTTTFTINADTDLTARGVTVNTQYGTSNPVTFTVLSPAPIVTSVSPPTANALGPVTVTITGSNFVAGQTTVTVGGTGVAVGTVNVLTPVKLTTTFTVSSDADRTARPVTVQTPLGSNSSKTFAPVTTPKPTILSFSQLSANATQSGLTLAITGSNFIQGDGATTVTFSGTGVTAGTVNVASKSSLTAVLTIAADAAQTQRNMTVTTPAGTSLPKLFKIESPAPTLSALSITNGSTLAPVNLTLTGTNFVASGLVINAGPDITVSNPQIVSPTTITATFTISAAAAPGPRNISVSTSFGTSGNKPFTINSATPTLLSITPNSGSSSAPVSVTLSGTNFVSPVTVQVSGASGITVSNVSLSGTTVATATFTIDPNADGQRTISVSSDFGTSNSVPFTIAAAPPTLSSIVPINGLAGTSVNVTLTGTHFVAGQTQFNIGGGGISITAVNFVNSTTATATLTIDANTAIGDRNVTATTLLGTTNPVTFTVYRTWTITATPADNSSWTYKGGLSTKRTHPAFGTSGGLIYAAGGWNAGYLCSYLNTMEAYNPSTDAWTSRASMPTAREGARMGIWNGKLYVVGGSIGCGTRTGANESYDPSSNTWTTLASMPTARTGLGVEVIDGVLYAVGGDNGTLLEAYDISANTWSAKASMASSHNGAATAVVNGKLYVFGGIDFSVNPAVANTSVEMYDPAINTWTARASMPAYRTEAAAAVVNGTVYVIGGSGASVFGSVVSYDPTADTWSSTLSSLNTARTQLGAVAISSTLYAFGGYTGSPYDSNSHLNTLEALTVDAAGSHGSISPSGSVVVNEGTDKAFTITPGTGYHIVDVAVDGSSVGAVTTRTFTNVTAAHTIAASFAIDTFTISASAGSNGSISPNGSVTKNYGSSQTFTIAPNTGYQVSDVLVDGSSVGAVTSYTFNNITANHTISASFTIITYTLTPSAGSNGSTSPSTAQTVNYGSNQAFTITPSTGYHVAGVFIDGSAVSVGALTSYTFTNVTADHSISATFAINTYTLTASTGANGSISPSGTATVNYGGSQTFNITPDTGYHIADVLVDGVSQGAITSYPFTNVAANHTVTASFAINTYTITVNITGSGSATPPGPVTVNYGGSKDFLISPDTGSVISAVTVNNVPQVIDPAGGTLSLTNVTADTTISIIFVP